MLVMVTNGSSLNIILMSDGGKMKKKTKEKYAFVLRVTACFRIVFVSKYVWHMLTFFAF